MTEKGCCSEEKPESNFREVSLSWAGGGVGRLSLKRDGLPVSSDQWV